MMVSASYLGVALLVFARLTKAATAEEWASQSIYQVMTDRFAVTDGSNPNCDLYKYCGGTWQGIRNKLDYIQEMGFTAIQISPVVKNFANDTAYGEAFHGYWPIDMYALNDNFGTADDLKALAKDLHDRNMYLMVDVVINDMATPINGDMTSKTVIDYAQFNPYNDAKFYHPYCNITDYANSTNAQDCWLGASVVALPDLDTESDVVASMMHNWIKQLVANYSIDGLRIDAAKHVNDDFLHTFVEAAGVFTFGEVYSGVIGDVCRYQSFMDGLPNYLTYFPLIQAFTAGAMTPLAQMVKDVYKGCKNITYMGSFVENHDLPRFASINPDLTLALNAAAFSVLADGIPTMYQGQEQHASGNYSPFNRGALWTLGYKTNAPIYNLTATLNKLRSHAINIDSHYITNASTELYVDDSTYATRKGQEGTQIVAVFSNQGSKGGKYDLVVPGAFAAGTKAVEITNCTEVTANEAGNITVSMDAGMPKAFYPSAQMNGSGLCGFSSERVVSTGNGTTNTTGGNPKKKGAAAQMQPSASTFTLCILFLSALLLL